MKKIVIRPSRHLETCPDVVKNLYISIGLDPELWNEEQEAEIDEEKTYVYYADHLYKTPLWIKYEDINNDEWEYDYLEFVGYYEFIINRVSIYVKCRDPFIENGDLWSGLDQEKREKIPHLIIETRKLKKLDNIKEYPNLKRLSLHNTNVDDMNGLLELKYLERLEITQNKSLKNFDTIGSLSKLVRLDLSYCEGFENLEFFTEINKITYLKLEKTKIKSISGIKKLNFLNKLWLEGCDELQDLDPKNLCKTITHLELTSKNINFLNINHLSEIKYLKITEYDNKIPLFEISSLEKIKELIFKKCGALTDLKELKNERLEYLHIDQCDSFNHINISSSFKGLKGLKITGCSSEIEILYSGDCNSLEHLTFDNIFIKDFKFIKSLDSLNQLSIKSILNKHEINFKENYQNLKSLSLYDWRDNISIVGFSSLINLKTLILESINLLNSSDLPCSIEKLEINEAKNFKIEKITNLPFLKNLRLKYYDDEDLLQLNYLENLDSLESIDIYAPIQKMEIVNNKKLLKLKVSSTILQTLKILNCPSLRHIEVSAREIKTIDSNNLFYLKTIKLDCCKMLNSVAFLESALDLKSIIFDGCRSLVNLSPLKTLNKLQKINISGCSYVKDTTFLKGKIQLTDLDLSYINYISDISSVSDCINLKRINIKIMPKLRSVEPLRSCTNLEWIKNSFDQGLLKEIIAFHAYTTHNIKVIANSAESWLWEINAFSEDSQIEQERLASTVALAVSLLKDSPAAIKLEANFDRHLAWGIAPWKSWFVGTLNNGGFELFKKRVERFQVNNISPSALGGVCEALRQLAPIEPEQSWARSWLASVELEWGCSCEELQNVAPELCLAYSHYGMMDSLERWIDRLTNPSDEGLLDEIHIALAKLRISSGDNQKARNHIFAIRHSEKRDSVLSELILSEVDDSPDNASEDLLLLDSSNARQAMAEKLCSFYNFLCSEQRINRLIAAACENTISLSKIAYAVGSTKNSDAIDILANLLELEYSSILEKSANQFEKMAIETRKRAINTKADAMDADHPEILKSISYLAYYLRKMGKYVESESLYQKALVGFSRRFGNDNEQTYRCAESYSYVLWDMSRKEDAKALVLEYSSFSKNAANYLLFTRACFFAQEGNLEEAKVLLIEHLNHYPNHKERALSDPDLVNLREFIKSII